VGSPIHRQQTKNFRQRKSYLWLGRTKMEVPMNIKLGRKKNCLFQNGGPTQNTYTGHWTTPCEEGDPQREDKTFYYCSSLKTRKANGLNKADGDNTWRRRVENQSEGREQSDRSFPGTQRLGGVKERLGRRNRHSLGPDTSSFAKKCSRTEARMPVGYRAVDKYSGQEAIKFTKRPNSCQNQVP